jgi:hypothetical protein
MKKHRRSQPLPLLLAELAFASWETIAWRGAMMAGGSCSAAEYRRMLDEKMRAAQLSALALMRGRDPAVVLAPWHRAASANARRLRKR